MEDKLITVVTVCYDAETDIEKTMFSVLNQTYTNLEYIIIDGASKDSTLEKVNQVSALYPKRRIMIVSEPDKGVYDAMNKGIDRASGKWINFMNAGDSFVCNDTIANIFNKELLNVDEIIYGDTILLYPVGNYYKNCSNGDWCHQSVFTPTHLMKRYHFDTRYRIMADEDFISKCIEAGYKLKYVPFAISCYECFYGLSSTNSVEMYLETAEIRKIKKSIRWKIELGIMRIKIYIKRLLLWDRLSTRDLEKLRTRLENNPRLKKLEP